MKLIFSIVLVLFLLASVSAVPFVAGAGASPSKKDRIDYGKRAANFYGTKFLNPDGKVPEGILSGKDEDPLRLSKNPVSPEKPLPVKKPELLENPSVEDFSFTWLGHSTILVQMHGMNILFDPVFGQKISPVSWAGPGRFTEPGIKTDELPEIDIVIYSHDHYDHLDYQTVKKLDAKVKKYLVPLGVECHLKKWNVNPDKIINMAWWEEFKCNGLTIASVPAKHFSGRWVTGRNESLWCGWVLKDEFRQVYESGDSGYGEHFKEIHDRYGDMDLAFLECGQYNKRWPTIHSFPEETVREAVELGAKLAMPVHWGAIVLSSNGWNDSVLRFVKAADECGLNYVTPYLSQTVDISAPENYRESWWSEGRACSPLLNSF